MFFYRFYTYTNYKTIQCFIFTRLEVIPNKLNTVAREIFRMAICLKPRLIRTGLQRIRKIEDSKGKYSGDIEKQMSEIN